MQTLGGCNHLSAPLVPSCVLAGSGEEEGGTMALAWGKPAHQYWDHPDQGAAEGRGEAAWYERHGIHEKETGKTKYTCRQSASKTRVHLNLCHLCRSKRQNMKQSKDEWRRRKSWRSPGWGLSRKEQRTTKQSRCEKRAVAGVIVSEFKFISWRFRVWCYRMS